MRIRPLLLVLLWIGVQLPGAAAPQTAARPRPLAASDIDAIAQLLKIEDTRQFDALALGRILKSTHPEVRRRAVQTIARVPGAEAGDLLTPMRTDADPEVVATVAFAYGQIKDTRRGRLARRRALRQDARDRRARSRAIARQDHVA